MVFLYRTSLYDGAIKSLEGSYNGLLPLYGLYCIEHALTIGTYRVKIYHCIYLCFILIDQGQTFGFSSIEQKLSHIFNIKQYCRYGLGTLYKLGSNSWIKHYRTVLPIILDHIVYNSIVNLYIVRKNIL